MQLSTTLSNVAALATFILLLAAALLYLLVRRNWIAAVCNLLPMVVHPAWTVGATREDYGIQKVAWSLVFLILALVMLLFAFAVVSTRGRKANGKSTGTVPRLRRPGKTRAGDNERHGTP